MPRAHTRGGVQQREGVPGWPTPRGRQSVGGLLPGRGQVEQRTGALRIDAAWCCVWHAGTSAWMHEAQAHLRGRKAPRGGVCVGHWGGDKNCRMQASTVASTRASTNRHSLALVPWKRGARGLRPKSSCVLTLDAHRDATPDASDDARRSDAEIRGTPCYASPLSPVPPWLALTTWQERCYRHVAHPKVRASSLLRCLREAIISRANAVTVLRASRPSRAGELESSRISPRLNGANAMPTVLSLIRIADALNIRLYGPAGASECLPGRPHRKPIIPLTLSHYSN